MAIGGRELTIPWAPASAWIDVIDKDHRTAAVALAQEGREDVAIGMALGEITLAQVERATHEAIEEVTGLRWWIALRLLYASGSTEILGALTLGGVDPDRVGLGQWCAAVYRTLTKGADKKQRMKIEFELEMPPAGYEEAWDDGNDYAAMVELARKVKEREAGRSG